MTFVRNHAKGIVACDFGADAFWAFAAVEQSGRQKTRRTERKEVELIRS